MMPLAGASLVTMVKPRELTPEERALWEQVNSTARTIPTNVSLQNQPMIHSPIPQAWAGTLDLHDLTLAEAHTQTNAHIKHAHQIGQRKIIIITGRSGLIAKEFPTWIQLNPLVTKRAILNGGGAWKLWVKRKLG